MTNKENTKQLEEIKLVDQILNQVNTGKVSNTKLETDEKVLARVTDGIYRLPGSALRELISNSYDADAENVIINTDVPRFESMTIRDDGNGMSIDSLVNLISHIGGSAKRSTKGKQLSVTDAHDVTISPNKHRKLIGKIGIGLFSVAQLTRDFEIITKQKGDNYYLKAKVSLYNYSEEYVQTVEKKNAAESDRGASFETGDVEIWTEETLNIEAHGTDIILRNIKKSARDLLKSSDIWGQESAKTTADENTDSEDLLNSTHLEVPSFHVGSLSGGAGFEYFDDTQSRSPELPWDESDAENKKFSKLYEGILSLTKNTVSPKLNIVLDNYLNMMWTLALSVPLDYIDGHPFDLTLNEMPDCYAISNKKKGQVTRVELDSKAQRFSDVLPLKTKTDRIDFNVIVDGVKLFRPIKFKGLPESRASVKKPILFLGTYTPDLSSMDIHDSAGELSFDAYLLWSPKVIPRDHTGVLVRLHNASGILFDETFMKHQVAEHTIKSQLTAEIFVTKGLDSALNIDRESFNISHPHYQIVMRWLHQAIRQVVNRYKTIKSEVQKENREKGSTEFNDKVKRLVIESLTNRGLDSHEMASFHVLDDDGNIPGQKDGIVNSTLLADAFTINAAEYKEAISPVSPTASKSKIIHVKTEALLQLLDSYQFLDDLTPEQQEFLITDLLKIISVEG